MTTPDSLAKDVGRLQGEMEAVQRDQAALKKAVEEVQSDLKTVLSILDQGKGGVRLLVWGVSLGASVGGALATFASWMGWMPKG